MENSVVNDIKSIFQGDTLAALANSSGETTDKIRSGLDAIIPIVFIGLQVKSTKSLHVILTQAKLAFGQISQQYDSEIPFDSTDQMTGVKPDFTQEIFGDNLSAIQESLQSYLGISTDTIQTLLAASLPAIFSVLTKAGQEWDTENVKNTLDQHKDEVHAAVPVGLTPLTVDTKLDPAAHAGIPPVTLADAIIDPTHTSPPQETIAEKIIHTPETLKQQKRGSGIWWFLALVILVALWVLFSKGCNGESERIDNDISTETR